MTTSSQDPTPADRPPAEGGDDVPPPEHQTRDDDDGAADDIAQFLDVDPPESPATVADIPAPPG